MAKAVKPILDMNAFDGARRPDEGSLLSRRLRNVGAASVLFYDQPLEIVRAEGVWMIAADGRRYLDFYNNVLSVGHCHARVMEAIAEQSATLTVNTRYLNARVDEYVERLKATLPVALSNGVLCCTGSEANDLALRVAMKATGGSGVVVTEAAYHGNTFLATQVSPSAWKGSAVPPHVRIVPAPMARTFGDGVADGFADQVRVAAADLRRHGIAPAALICDSIFSSDGVHADPQGFLAPAVQAMRAAGGLYIADEVQPGFARTGDAMWGFQRHGVEPDIVTMGKPMGNGFPVAGMFTRPELLAAFCEDVGYFNTFAGNPVAAAAGLAVLDVIADEGLQDNAANVGVYLRRRLGDVASAFPVVGEVRGAGLFLGIELVRPDSAASAPDADQAAAVIKALVRRGVLIGAAGRHGNVLKVRPPLCLRRDDADVFVDALADSLAELDAA